MSSNGQMTPFPKIDMIVVLVHIIRRKNLKAVRGSYLPFVIKHALFPLGTTSLVVSCSSLWGVCPNFRQTGQFFYHIILVAWHYIKQGFMFFWSFFNFFRIKMPWHALHACALDTNMFENSFEFTAHGINSHTSTQKYDFSNCFG